MDLDYIKKDVIGRHKRSIRLYTIIIVGIIVGGLYTGWYFVDLAKLQQEFLSKMMEGIDKKLLSESLAISKPVTRSDGFNIHIYYSIVGFLSFALFLIAGLIKFHVGEIAKAQKVIYGFMRIDRDEVELSSEARNELVKNAFSTVDEKPIEVHAGLDALKSSVETISSNISSIAKAFKK